MISSVLSRFLTFTNSIISFSKWNFSSRFKVGINLIVFLLLSSFMKANSSCWAKSTSITIQQTTTNRSIIFSQTSVRPVIMNISCESLALNTIYYQVFQAAESTWGYDIIKDGKIFIHQPFAPGISGKRGFSSKSKAEMAAKLVIEKINKGIMPPSLSIEEVQKIERKK
jgi:hypothetical protein